MAIEDNSEPRERDGGLVVILGAGFSKAVHQVMPLTDELGESVSERLSPADRNRLPQASAGGRRFTGGRFEEWLSYLAEEQPHLLEDESLEARALLIRVTRAIQDVLSEAQSKALHSGPPPWFFPLLSALGVQEATVISLNYDNLVECGAEHLGMTEERLLGGRPRLAESVARVSGCEKT